MVWYQTRGLVESRVRWRNVMCDAYSTLTCWFMCHADMKLFKHRCMGLGPQAACIESDTCCSRYACNIKLHLPSSSVKTVLVWWLQINNFFSYPLYYVLSTKKFLAVTISVLHPIWQSQMWLQSFKRCCSGFANEFLPELLNQILWMLVCLYHKEVLPLLLS